MAPLRLTLLAAPFLGRWRIIGMDLWKAEALDIPAPAFLEISGERGEMGFIAVRASLDIRYGTRAGNPVAEFSWEGVDAGEPRSGRGWTERTTPGKLVGHLYFHKGDDSAFVCERW